MTERIDSIRWVLVDLIYDFCGAAEIYRDYSSRESFNPYDDMEYLSAIRVCQTSAIIGLSRLWELLNGFGKEVNDTPEPMRSKLIQLRTEIEKRKIYQFRSKYIGHVFDDDTKSPIKIQDGYPRLMNIVGSDWESFYNWIFPGPDRITQIVLLGWLQSIEIIVIQFWVTLMKGHNQTFNYAPVGCRTAY
mgnify:CR=1 FL=1